MNKVEEVIDLLIKNKFTITTAESCTGGLLASSIVSIPNASKVFNEAYITYSNESKVRLLGVKSRTIDNFGVVSEEVTKEMALGAANRANSDCSIVTSGIAGPTGATKNKPIGMVCFGIYLNGDVQTFTKKFGNVGRNQVRELSKEFIFQELERLLNKI